MSAARRGILAAESSIVLRGAFSRENLAGSALDPEAYATLLRRCGELGALDEGKWIHDHLAGIGLDRNTFLANLLVQMYGKCGSVDDARRAFRAIRAPNLFSSNLMLVALAQNGHLDEARRIFDGMREERDHIAWNAMIAFYARAGRSRDAVGVLRLMESDGHKPSSVTFVGILSCIDCPGLAREMHSKVAECGFQSDVRIATGILGMYTRCSEIPRAKMVFDSLTERDVVSWTAMLVAYAQNGHIPEGKELLRKMPVSNLFSWNAMIDAYGRTGSVEDAEQTYRNMPSRDLVTVNSMIGAYALNGELSRAMLLFRTMDAQGLRPNCVTFCAVLDACRNVAEARLCHACARDCDLEGDCTVGNALISAYGRYGSVGDARRVFDSLPERNVVSWTAMVAANAHSGHRGEAAALSRAMDLHGVSPNGVTFVNLLTACSQGGLVDEGCEFFASMWRDRGIDPEAQHYRCLVDLFGRVGQLPRAEEVMDLMPWEPDALTWITFLNSCKIHGDVRRAASCAARALELGHLATPVLVKGACAGAGLWRRETENILNDLEEFCL